MNTKYDIGDKVWVGTYRNRTNQLEVLPIRDGFNDLSLIAVPTEARISEIRITDKEVIYGTSITQARGTKYSDISYDEYMIWFREIDIFNSREECQEEKERRGNRFIRKRTGKCTCCCCKCCNK
jgi:hypothetical protein